MMMIMQTKHVTQAEIRCLTGNLSQTQNNLWSHTEGFVANLKILSNNSFVNKVVQDLRRGCFRASDFYL